MCEIGLRITPTLTYYAYNDFCYVIWEFSFSDLYLVIVSCKKSGSEMFELLFLWFEPIEP